MSTGHKYHKDKMFARIEHTATSGVVGKTEYEVLGEINLSIATTFATSGTLTIQGRIKYSTAWQTVGTLTFGGDFDTLDISAYDYIRFNFTVAAGSTGEIAASGFFKAASGGGGGATTSFTTVQTDAGTSPVSDAADDTLTLTSSDSTVTITGNSTTDTVDFTNRVATGSVSGIVSTGSQTFAGAKTFSGNINPQADIGDTTGTGFYYDQSANVLALGKANQSTANTPVYIAYTAADAFIKFESSFSRLFTLGNKVSTLEIQTSNQNINWVPLGTQIMRGTNSSVGIGQAYNGDTSYMLGIKGKSATSSDYSIQVLNSASTQYFAIRNDGYIYMSNLPVYADDSAAGTGGVPTGALYQTSTGEMRIKT